MADIQYLNYGDLQIEKLAFLNKAANEVQNYVQKLPWSNKRKLKFMSAYSDIMSRGINGASNSTGQWVINVGGNPIDLNSKDRKDREMYQEAAYFFQQQMAGLPTKASEEEKKEEDKSKLPVFDNNTFKTGFLTQISNDYFGGSKDIKTSDWNEYDKRDDKGIRGRTERANMLIKSLEKYALNLELNKDKYNFEDSPFGSLDEFKNRIANARKALVDTPTDTDDDFKALNALGLNASDWFNNGSGDPSGQYITLSDGTLKELTYGQLAEYNQKLAKLKAELEAETNKKKLMQQLANRFNYVVRSNIKMVGQNPQVLALKYKNDQGILNQLSLYAQSGNLTPEQWSEILGAYKFYNSKGVLLNLSKLELGSFNGLRNYNGLGPGVLKKLPGVDGLYFDTRTGLVIKAGRREQQPILGLLELNSPEALKEKQKKLAELNMNTPLSLMTEWTPKMKKEMEAIAWDVASILDPEAFSGSAMALYASHLRDEANPNRGTLEKWIDRGTAALGGILGVGDLLVTGKLGYRLYQLGKSMGSVSKFAGMLGTGFGAIGAYEAKDSIAKLTNPSSLTPLDIENISYGFMGLIGLKSFAKARNKLTIGKQANPTIAEHNITINDKNGSHIIKVDEATAKEINNSYKFGRNNKTKSDAKTFNHEKVKKAVEEYNENPENTKKIDLESASIQSSSKFGITTEKPVKTNYVKNPNTSEYAPVGTKWYSPFGYMAQGNNKWGYYLGGGWQRKAWESAIPELSSKGLWLKAKEFWSPNPKPILSKPKETPSETPKSETNSKKSWSEIEKGEKQWTMNESMKEWKNILKGELKPLAIGENFKAGDFHFNVMGHSGSEKGMVEINFGSKRKSIKFENLKDLRKKVLKFMKENAPKTTVDGKSKYDAKKMGEILKLLKAKGVFKQGGTIDKQKIQKYKEFIKK